MSPASTRGARPPTASMPRGGGPRSTPLVIGSVVLLALLALSGARPYDRATWAMEVAPVVVVLPLLWATWRRFPLTGLLYACIFVHALVLMLGGAYSYARVPLGFEIADALGLQRNPYDKIGHFFQGFVPALAAREILVRGAWVRGRAMLAFLVVCVVLAVSATYEFIEWGAALALGQGGRRVPRHPGRPLGHAVRHVRRAARGAGRAGAAVASARPPDRAAARGAPLSRPRRRRVLDDPQGARA